MNEKEREKTWMKIEMNDDEEKKRALSINDNL